MIERDLSAQVHEAAKHYPVVTVTGPRQSGKTTLCRALFPDRNYVSLEPLDARAYARSDPRGFLAEHGRGALLDEVQHAPELLSYLQEEVDARPAPGRFILTGSQHFSLLAAITQSLAGRTAVLHLLPLSLDEVMRFPRGPRDLFTVLFEGGYPRIHDRRIPAARWLADYLTTYVQRDVREVLRIGDLEVFTTFLRLCAGRSAQEINLSALGADAGISHNTARSWLSALETSFLCFRLPAWHRNFTKQLVKAAKLHLLDTGLLCHLLGIREAGQLRHHPLRGAVFETWVASEIYKARVHRGLEPALFHFRESRGVDVDVVIDDGDLLALVEAKSGATVAEDFFGSLGRLRDRLLEHSEHRTPKLRLVYGGDSAQRRHGVQVIPWREISHARW
jgi:predicted AAA+ superfamily ATPase